MQLVHLVGAFGHGHAGYKNLFAVILQVRGYYGGLSPVARSQFLIFTICDVEPEFAHKACNGELCDLISPKTLVDSHETSCHSFLGWCMGCERGL